MPTITVRQSPAVFIAPLYPDRMLSTTKLYFAQPKTPTTRSLGATSWRTIFLTDDLKNFPWINTVPGPMTFVPSELTLFHSSHLALNCLHTITFPSTAVSSKPCKRWCTMSWSEIVSKHLIDNAFGSSLNSSQQCQLIARHSWETK